MITEKQPDESYSLDSEFPKTPLNINFTFVNFVSGAGNQLALDAAIAVATNPNETYNPLFIYGESGLGKSHLLNAIGNRIKCESNLKVCYCTTENFLYDLVKALRKKKLDLFRAFFRNLDVLLVDDIEFMFGMSSTQEEFYKTVKVLQDNNKQIVVTAQYFRSSTFAECKPIITWLKSGLIIELKPPNRDTIAAILKQRAEFYKIQLSDDIIDFIISHQILDIRELMGILNKLKAYSSLHGVPISFEMVRNILKDYLDDKNTPPPVLKSQVKYDAVKH